MKNRELRRDLDRLMAVRSVTGHWVAGHPGHAEHECCDEWASAGRRGLRG